MSSTTRGGQQRPKGEVPAVVALPHGRVPPHSADAERSLLGGILMDPQALNHLEISAADFFLDRYGVIYRGMAALHADGEPVDRITVRNWLTENVGEDRGRAELEQHLEVLDAVVPNAANLTYYAKIIRDKALARRLIEQGTAIAQLGYEQHGNVAEFAEECRRRISTVLDGGSWNHQSPHISIDRHAIKLSRERIRSRPPDRAYMLCDERTGAGVYVQGKVGLFVAAGGTGKTWALSQLITAVSTGTTWFGPGGWAPVRAGRILAVFGEETEDESLRNMHFSALASPLLGDEEIDMMVKNVTVLPMAGRDVSLTTDVSETAFAGTIREHLRAAAAEGNPYVLVVLDPLARFAGPDVEISTYAATMFIRVLESFAAPQFGSPSVVLAHHTRKAKNSDDDRPDSADVARGASGIKDGARWMARLEQVEGDAESADLLTLRIPKANGIPRLRMPLILCRSATHEGALRVAYPAEIASNKKLSSLVKSKVQELADYEERVLETLGNLQAHQEMSANKICELSGNREATLAAIRKLLKEKKIQVGKKYLRLPLAQRSLFDGTTSGTTSGTTRPNGPDLPGSRPPPPAVKPERERNQQGQPAAEPVASGQVSETTEPVPGTTSGTTNGGSEK